eukprot:UN03504
MIKINTVRPIRLPTIPQQNNNTSLRVGTLNVQSMYTTTTNKLRKIDNILLNLPKEKFNVLSLQETLHEGCILQEVNNNALTGKYSIFDIKYKPSDEENKNYTRGLVMLVDSDLSPIQRQEYSNEDDGNMLAVSCLHNEEKVLMFNIYRNPSDKSRTNKALKNCHNNINKALLSGEFDSIVVCGDFNTKPSDLAQLLPTTTNYRRNMIIQNNNITYISGNKIKTSPDNIIVYNRNPCLFVNKMIRDSREITKHFNGLHRLVQVDICNTSNPFEQNNNNNNNNNNNSNHISSQKLINNA